MVEKANEALSHLHRHETYYLLLMKLLLDYAMVSVYAMQATSQHPGGRSFYVVRDDEEEIPARDTRHSSVVQQVFHVNFTLCKAWSLPGIVTLFFYPCTQYEVM